MNTITMTKGFAVKGDLETAAWSSSVETLIAVYVDSENKFWYAVSEKGDRNVIRKMSISRDINYARSVYKKAKELVGQEVRFGVTSGWNPLVWFNDIELV